MSENVTRMAGRMLAGLAVAMTLGLAGGAKAEDAFATLAAKVGSQSLPASLLAQYGCPAGPLDLDAPARARTVQVIVNRMFVWDEVETTRADGTPSLCLRLEKPARRYLSPEETRLLLLGQRRLSEQAKAARQRAARPRSQARVVGEFEVTGKTPSISRVGPRPASFPTGESVGSVNIAASKLRTASNAARDKQAASDPLPELNTDDTSTADVFENIHVYHDDTVTEYPFQVIGYMFIQDNAGGFGSCTGTMVAPRTVLTAGHCMYSLLDQNSDLNDNPGFATDATFSPGQYTLNGALDLAIEPFGQLSASKVDAFRVLTAFRQANDETWPNFDVAALITEETVEDFDTFVPVRFSQSDTSYNRLGYSGSVIVDIEGEENPVKDDNLSLVGSFDTVRTTATGYFEFANNDDYFNPGVSGGPVISASNGTYALDAVNSYFSDAGSTGGAARVQSSFEATITNWIAAGTGDGSGEVEEPSEAGETIEIFRFYNVSTGVHFYTASKAERDSVAANLSQYKYEQNAGFMAFAAGDSSTGAIPVYRFYNSVTGTHFYTASTAERDNIITTLPAYSYEGVAFNAYSVSDANCKSRVFRFLNRGSGTHFYTSNLVERDVVRSTRQDMNYEGPVFCAAE